MAGSEDGDKNLTDHFCDHWTVYDTTDIFETIQSACKVDPFSTNFVKVGYKGNPWLCLGLDIFTTTKKDRMNRLRNI